MTRPSVDREKVRVLLERVDTDDLRELVHRAADLLSATQITTWLEGHTSADELRRDARAGGALLAKVSAFHAASVRGAHYESFNVNSKNFMEQSRGTRTWIAECRRLFGQCATAAGKGRHREARDAFELLFDLLRRLDEGEDIVFFADEGGAWQVGVDWRETLPGYFACLAATAEPEVFAATVRAVIEKRVGYDQARYIGEAKRAASREQRKALERRPSRRKR
jgi:hypothetical protein